MEINTSSDKKNRILIKSQNEFINSRFQFSQVELDMIFYLLSLLKQDCKTYSFRVSEMYDLIGKEWKKEQILPNCKSLMTRHILRFIDDTHWEIINLFEKIRYNEGVIEMTITSDAARILSDSKKNYTLMELCSALSLKSKYSKRLYWLLCMWRKRGQVYYLLDDLRDHLGTRTYNTKNECISDACRQNGLLKSRCEEWVAEINELTELSVKISWYRRGRSIEGVFFYLSEKRSNLIMNFPDNDIEKKKAITLFKNYGLNDKQAEEVWCRGCTVDIFKKIIEDANKRIKKSNEHIWNPTGFLIGILENKGYITKEKPDLLQLEKKRREEVFMSERAGIIKGLRVAVETGVSMSSMSETMEKYGISEKEIFGD